MYASLVDGAYGCVDRIVLNAYFRFAQSPAGFRLWWRQLYGTDDDLDNAHLMRMAGRFRRRLRAWAIANNIPLRSCRHGEQKHEIAEQYREQTSIQEGLFLILEGRAQAPVWDVLNSGRIQHKIPYPYVNHYSFHILDRDWGHVTIKISGHPPFPAQIILNGHEYVERQAAKAGIDCKKEGNCFSRIADAGAFAAIAEALTAESVIGRLTAVCDRWIYKTCLCFALDREERERSRFRYQYSIYQLEYSRNLLFKKGSQMQQVVETLVDRNRTRMNVKRLKTILGRKNRPHHRKKKPAQWQITIERPSYDLTIFKVYCGKMALKIYTKGERVLRAEAMAIDARGLRCGRDVGQFAKTATKLKEILERFLETLCCLDRCFVSADSLDELSSPSKAGTTQVGGIDFNRPRMRWVARALLALSVRPGGFTASQLAQHVRGQGSGVDSQYGPRQAAYDLQKFRGKKLVCQMKGGRRYETLPAGLRTISALLLLRDQVLAPLLASTAEAHDNLVTPAEPTLLDRLYAELRGTMRQVFDHLGLAA